MNARLVALIVLAGLALKAPEAEASTRCQNTIDGTLCVSEVGFADFAQRAYQTQLQSQWCWAATISMIFAYHGMPVSQERIVTEVYGSPVNMPAGSGIVMAQQLNRQWRDDAGAPFAARVTGLYDGFAGIYNLTNAQMVAELDRGNPLVIANRTHAMVLTSLTYYRTPQGPNVVAGGVFDPWPTAGPRPLRATELVPVHTGVGELSFLATVSIEDGSRPPVDGPDAGADGGGGGTDVLLGAFLIGALALRRSALRRCTDLSRR